MNIVDSSGWLEYFADGENAGFFANPIQDLEALHVPTISLYEVFKHVLIHRSEGEALRAVATMQQGSVIDLDGNLAITAAKISAESKIPMADSVMLASARAIGATLWSQDKDFEGMSDVEYVEK